MILLIWLYILKDKLKIKYYLLSGIISFLVSIIIFPYLIKHIFFGGYRGKEAINNLFESNFIERLKIFYSDSDCFNSIGFAYTTGSNFFILILLILFFICIIKKYLKIEVHVTRDQSVYLHFSKKIISINSIFSSIKIDNRVLCWLIIGSVFIFPILLVTKIAPFLDMRYITPQFPIFTIIMTGLFYFTFEFLKLNRISITLFVCFLFFALANISWHPSKVHWYFNTHKQTSQIFSDYPTTVCVNISDNKTWWPVISQGYNFIRCPVTLIFESNNVNYNLLKSLNPKSIVLYESFINKNKRQSKAIANSLNLHNIKYLYNDHGKVFHIY